jgi:hypothetical protein
VGNPVLLATPFSPVGVYGEIFTFDRHGRHMDRNQNSRANWEYEILRPPRDETKKEAANPKSKINALAADGWRLIETIDYTGGGTKYIVFERPRSDGNNSHEDSS